MDRAATSRETIRRKLEAWLLEGISPQRLALTLALGFVLGCIPMFGIPTGLCVVIAVVFRLNQAAIQAANYAAMPFQLALIAPFVRLGGKLTPTLAHPALDMRALTHSPLQMIMHSSTGIAAQFAVVAGQALLAWLLVAVPVAAMLTLTLTGVLRRVPVVAAVRPRD